MFKELCDLRKYYGAEGNLFVFRQEGGKKRHLAEFLFDNALKKGELNKGMPVAEITAGNFGLALAKLCAKNKSRLYLVPIGKLDSKTLKRLKKFDVVLVEAVPKEGEKYWQALYRTLDETIESQKAFSFKQFENREQIDYYLNLFELFPDITVDCCFDKMGCGATLAALHKKYPKAEMFFATTNAINVDKERYRLFDDGFFPQQIFPCDKKEYFENFEKVLDVLENIKNAPYAKLSLFCALQYLKANKGKNAFVFIGD